MKSVQELEARLPNDTVKSVGHALAGACAGATAMTILFPLDTVKTRQTTQSGRIYTYPKMVSDLIHFRNLDDLYRGYRIGLIEVILFQGIHFFFYNLLKTNWYKTNVPHYSQMAVKDLPQMPPLQSVGRGCFAGLMTQLLTTPFGVVKARLQTSTTDETVFDVVKSIYEEDGITGFWRGMKTSVILIINPVIVFFIFERLQQLLRKRFGSGFWVDFVTGGLSKSVAAIICQPLTFVKTNLQAAQKSKSKLSDFRSRTSTQRLRPPGYDSQSQSEAASLSNINEEIIDSPLLTPGLSEIANDNNSNKNSGNTNSNGVLFNDNLEIINESKHYHSNNNGIVDDEDDEECEDESQESLKRTTSMSAMFKYTIENEGIGGLYQGLGPKLLHAALLYAFIFSCKEKFTYYTFMALIAMSKKRGKVPPR